MNDTLKRIKEESYTTFDDVNCQVCFDGGKIDVLDINLFATLIIRECIDIANMQFEAATGLKYRDSWTANEIKEHFGIE